MATWQNHKITDLQQCCALAVEQQSRDQQLGSHRAVIVHIGLPERLLCSVYLFLWHTQVERLSAQI